MSLTINTNLSSLLVQKSLSESTSALNNAIERMTTGYKINSAADDAAGYAVATKMATKLSSIQVCMDNVAMGQSLLSTASSTYDITMTHLQRMRDLLIELSNGTYGDDSVAAIESELHARSDEINRILYSAEFNSNWLWTFASRKTFNIQVGIDTTANSTISITTEGYENIEMPASFSYSDTYTISEKIDYIDDAISFLTTQQTNIGAYQNRLDSAMEQLQTQYTNVTSSLSTIKDADVAKESSSYIKAQILQQASATLLSTANQSPSIALGLI